MRQFLFLPILIGIAACTSVETYHNACIEGHVTIAGQVGCVRANIMQDEWLRGDTLAQEYLRTGELLVQQVNNGEISEEEAQLRFVQTLNRIRQEELREHAYRAAIDRANRDLLPRETVCEEQDDRVYCTTF